MMDRIPTFTDADALQRQLVFMVNKLLAELTEGASPQEMASWATKAEAAREIVAGGAGAGETEMIETEAGIRGKDAREYAAKIVAKADSFEALVSTIMGIRGKFSDMIAAAKPEELDAIFAAADGALNDVRKAAQ